MHHSFRIGIDVGGTTVDFALIDCNHVLIDSDKRLITEELNTCIVTGLQHFINKRFMDVSDCQSIHIGTTIAINSLLELKSLYRVGVLRLAGHQPDLEPAYYFSEQHKKIILSGYKTINGGKEFNHKPITLLQETEVISAVCELIANGAESLAIIGTFSPLYPNEEKRVKEIISQNISNAIEIPITLSHQIGGLDFIERENSAIVNAALKKVMQLHFHTLESALKNMHFECPIFITQNNGTLLSLQEAIAFPVKTISSGPTNSLVGASKLASLKDTIVVDIGGTSTDIGIVENGFPRYSSLGSEVAGIPFNFLMPDIHALALGGGSIIHEKAGQFLIGPDSIGNKIFSQSKSFFGQHLTLFDIGNILKKIKHPHGTIPNLNFAVAEKIMKNCVTRILDTVEKIGDKRLPIVLVGGGSQNIPAHLLNNRFLRPQHYQVANAYGAALAEISGTVDKIVYLHEQDDIIMKNLEKEAINAAIQRGAHPDKVRIIEKSLFPFYYMPNKMTRVVISAAGTLN